jgi:hypothetical protein
MLCSVAIHGVIEQNWSLPKPPAYPFAVYEFGLLCSTSDPSVIDVQPGKTGLSEAMLVGIV